MRRVGGSNLGARSGVDIHACTVIYPQDELVRLRRALDEFDIKLHCDGARMWEVLAATGMSLKEACAPFHSVSLCLSKGIGAPIGR